MTFNNETNIVIGNKHNNEQQQHEHRTGRFKIFFLFFEIFGKKNFHMSINFLKAKTD
jgi:hypothetical protein